MDRPNRAWMDESKNKADYFALIDAIKSSDEDVVRSLVDPEIGLQNVVDPDLTWRATPLQEAIDLGDEHIALILIDAGVTGHWNRQARHIRSALEKKLFRVPRMLLERTNQDWIDEVVSSDLYPLLIVASQSENVEAVELLIKYGAKIDFQDTQERTALLVAVQNGYRDVVEALIRHGARLDLTKRDGKTPLDIAIELNEVEISTLILDKFCSANGIQNKADFTLDKAIKDGEDHTALKLMEIGSDFASRVAKTTQQSRNQPLVGSRNQYLKSLCSSIIALKRSTGDGFAKRSGNKHTDAVKITRRLGVRYLWIDTLCIIQDSHSDWSVEAYDMAKIYRNAILTIAAASASDHSEGCFSNRIAEDCGDPLSSRGWILQEQLLSQRILKYSSGFLEWECISHSANELNPAKSSNPSEILRFKRALGGFRSTSMPLKQQAHTSWQQIVTAYSHRTLTKDSDKLMAIMGIAKFTGSIMQDTFLAGLWESQLWRDLLWSSDLPYGGARLTSIKLPTWSWASVEDKISYKWPSSSSPAYVKSMLDLVSAEVDQEITNRDVNGRLVVRGRLRKVTRGSGFQYESTRLYPTGIPPTNAETGQDESPESQRPGEEGSTSSLGSLGGSTRADSEFLYQKIKFPTSAAEFWNEINKSARVSATFWPDVADDGFEIACLLPIATQHCWIHCLVLVAVDDEGLGCTRNYRRVGLCHVDRIRDEHIFDGCDVETISLM
ncbi:hypothetical protein IFR05_011786 [Cadophora sp. M221]|nr:hypothetical protein IFR05_011786 [Cadophora sp. M221]